MELDTAEMQEVGCTPVDSGQLLLCDPCYLPLPVQGGGLSKGWSFDATYEQVSAVSCGYLHAGEVSCGVVVSTGWGDGSYPVYVARKHGRIVAVTVVFDEDEQVD